MKLKSAIAFLQSGPFRINLPKKVEREHRGHTEIYRGSDISGRDIETGGGAETQGFDDLQEEVAATGRAVAAPPSPAPAAPSPGDVYLTRLVKLIPAEVLSLYLTFKEVAASWLGTWALICLGLVLLVRTVGTHQAGKPIQFAAVFISLVSFALWIYATGGYFLGLHLPASWPGAVSVGIGVWTFVVPYFYKGD